MPLTCIVFQYSRQVFSIKQGTLSPLVLYPALCQMTKIDIFYKKSKKTYNALIEHELICIFVFFAWIIRFEYTSF